MVCMCVYIKATTACLSNYSPVTTCTDLTRPNNAMISYTSGGSIDNRPIGTVATYSCDTGYTLNGDRVRTCQSDGTWSGSVQTCKSESLLQVTHTMTIYYPLSLLWLPSLHLQWLSWNTHQYNGRRDSDLQL